MLIYDKLIVRKVGLEFTYKSLIIVEKCINTIQSINKHTHAHIEKLPHLSSEVLNRLECEVIFMPAKLVCVTTLSAK